MQCNSMELELDPEILIPLVGARPSIWDKSLEPNKAKADAAIAWREIFEELNQDYNELSEIEKNAFAKAVIAKWTNVRDRYTKYLKQVEDGKVTKTKGRSIRKYIYSNHLTFLQKNLLIRRPRRYIQHDEENTMDDNTMPEPEVVDEKIFHDLPDPISPVIDKRQMQTPFILKPEKTINQQILEPENRHISFFKGILPSLEEFNNNETIHFQIEVLNVIQNIYKTREMNI